MGINGPLVVAASLGALTAVLGAFLWGLSRGPNGRGRVADEYLAVARCRSCAKEYECEWVPGASFHAVRWFGRRYQRCLSCRAYGWSDFVRWAEPNAPRSLRALKLA